jgi:peptidyl-prolyl cis-trans isomerase C
VRGAVLLTLAALLSSCSDERTGQPAPRDQQADLGGDVIARISAGGASDAVPKSILPKVAAELKVEPVEAARRLVDDAIASVAARERGLDEQQPTRFRLRSARARMTIERIRAQSRADGPPAEEEIKELTARHWRQVDRPEAARTVTVVVMRATPPNAELDERAKALAKDLHAALLDTSSPDEFSEKAQAFPHPADIKIQVDTLPPIIEEGYSIEGPDYFDETFAKAANALKKPGDTSPIVETKKFGWHIIRLVEKVPEQRMPLDERRIAFTEDAYSLRAHKALAGVIGPLRQTHRVTIEPSAETLMRSVMTTGEAK